MFLIDSKHKDHDGKIFCNIDDAKDFVKYCLDGVYASKAVIGFFIFDPLAQSMGISMIQTFGFTGDKKDFNQLKLSL